MASTVVAPEKQDIGRWSWLNTGRLVPIAAAVILVYLTVIPLFMLLHGSLRTEVARNQYVYTLQNYIAAYTTSQTYTTLATSFVFAMGSCLLGLGLGLVLAWIIERTNTPFREYFYALSLVPLILPGVLVTIAWIFLLSPRFGWINSLLMTGLGLESAPFNIFTLGGMIWVEGLRLSALAFLGLSAAFKSMDPALEESAMLSGAGTLTTLRRITLRLMVPAIAAAALILFVQGLEAFEVPALVGIPAKQFVFTSEIFLALRKYPPDFGYGGALAVGLLAVSALGVWLYGRATRRGERFQTVTGKAFRPRTIDLGPFRWAAFGFLVVYFLLAVGLPFLILLWASFLPFFQVPNPDALSRASLDNYAFVLQYPAAHRAFINSLLLGVGAATLVMLLTAIISWIVVKTRLPGRSLLDYLAFLPIGVPGLVLGVSLIWLYLTFPLPIYGTLWVLLIAYMTRYMPFGMRAASASMTQIHTELEEAAMVSGASWWTTFQQVVLPLLRPGLVAGWIYIFVVSVRELSSSILLATGDSVVLSILIFDLFEGGKSTAVAALAVMLILSLLLVVTVVVKLSGRVGLRTV